MLDTHIGSRDSDPEKLASIFQPRTNKLSKFCVPRNLSNMLLLTLERTSCYLLWEKKICRTVHRRTENIFVKIWIEKSKKSFKNETAFFLSVYLFYWPVVFVAARMGITTSPQWPRLLSITMDWSSGSRPRYSSPRAISMSGIFRLMSKPAGWSSEVGPLMVFR